MSNNTNPSRRRFIKLGAASVAAVPLANLAFGRIAWSEELPHVEESDPQAQGLGYVHDASKVDTAKFTKFAEGQNCANCQLYINPEEGKEWGPCAIFPGKAVNVNGWCSAWVAKTG
jgi:hypothetical protein